MHIPELSHSQNFLHSPALVKALIDLTNINRGDVVVEIGPGKGIITRQLAKACASVVGVEYDAALCEKLRRRFGDFEKSQYAIVTSSATASSSPVSIT